MFRLLDVLYPAIPSIVAVFVFVCVWSPRGRARDRMPSVASLTGLYYGITLIAQIATTPSLSRV